MNQADGMKPTYSTQNPLVNKLMTPAKKIARYNMAVNKKKPNKKLIFKQIQQVSQRLNGQKVDTLQLV